MILVGTGSVRGVTGWYLVVLGQCKLVPLGIRWNWVITKLLCRYVLKTVEIWSDVTIAGQQTNDRTRKDKATQPMDQGRLR